MGTPAGTGRCEVMGSPAGADKDDVMCSLAGTGRVPLVPRLSRQRALVLMIRVNPN